VGFVRVIWDWAVKGGLLLFTVHLHKVCAGDNSEVPCLQGWHRQRHSSRTWVCGVGQGGKGLGSRRRLAAVHAVLFHVCWGQPVTK
jgi:hypothetical protein